MPCRPKRILNAEKLSEAGMTIHYHENEDRLQEILKSIQHGWAASQSEKFLNFEHILRHEDQTDIFEDGEEIPENRAYLFVTENCPNEVATPSRFARYKDAYPGIQEADCIRSLARDIAAAANAIKDHDEQRWVLFMHRLVFEEYHLIVRKNERIMAQRPLSEKELMCDFRIGSEHSWVNGGALLERNRRLRGNHCSRRLTDPKPDLYIAFHLHTTDDPVSEYDNPVSQMFDYETLQNLAQASERYDSENERFQPCHLVDYAHRSPANEKGRVVFPWLIGEWKHAGVSSDEKLKVIWQAANGCAVALMLLAKLVSHDAQARIPRDIPPVFAITSVGPKASLWVAYVKNYEKDGALRFEMHRIWHGDLARQLYAIELCLFLVRLREWATDILRRLVSKYIKCLLHRLENQNSFNTNNPESSANVDGIGLYESAADFEQLQQEAEIEQAEQMTEYLRGYSPTILSSVASGSLGAEDFNSKQNSESAEDFEPAIDQEDALYSENESGSEYVPSQHDKTDSDDSFYSDFGPDPLFEECLERNTELDGRTFSDHETSNESDTGSENIVEETYMETPRPITYRTQDRSKKASPGTTPLATKTSTERAYFDAPLGAPGQTAPSFFSNFEHPQSTEKARKVQIAISDSPTPLRQCVGAEKTMISASISRRTHSEPSSVFRQTASVSSQDTRRKRIGLVQKFAYTRNGVSYTDTWQEKFPSSEDWILGRDYVFTADRAPKPSSHIQNVTEDSQPEEPDCFFDTRYSKSASEKKTYL